MKMDSANVGNLRTKAIAECICNCRTRRIGISRFHETHNGRNGNHVYEDYAILYTAAGKAINNQNNYRAQWVNNWRWGVAILIKEDYVENVERINRIGSRIVEIR